MYFSNQELPSCFCSTSFPTTQGLEIATIATRLLLAAVLSASITAFSGTIVSFPVTTGAAVTAFLSPEGLGITTRTSVTIGTRTAAVTTVTSGNYALGIREQLLFPEIEYDKVETVRGMEMIFVTTAHTDEECKELLAQLGMPFAK